MALDSAVRQAFEKALSPADVITDQVRAAPTSATGSPATGSSRLVLLPRDAEEVAGCRAGLRTARGAVRRPRCGHRPVRRRAARRRRRRDLAGPAARASSRSTRSTAGRSSSRASPTSAITRRPRRTGSTTRPTRRASRSARSAATSRRTPAARTASSTASPPTTCWRSRSCCADGARGRRSAADTGEQAGPDLRGVSSARRARSASSPRSPCGCCARPRRCGPLLADFPSVAAGGRRRQRHRRRRASCPRPWR